MKNSKNRLFDELKGSKMTKKSMVITKGGTTTSDAYSTKPGQPVWQDR
jgi:hypothetical protein